MASSQTSQRLLRELKDYSKNPNEALLHLGPVDEEDLLRWEAVLKGVPGSPYEGSYPLLLHSNLHPLTLTLTLTRRPLAPRHNNPPELPIKPAQNPLHDSNLTPEYLVHDRRDLFDLIDNRALEPRLYAFDHDDSDSPIAY